MSCEAPSHDPNDSSPSRRLDCCHFVCLQCLLEAVAGPHIRCPKCSMETSVSKIEAIFRDALDQVALQVLQRQDELKTAMSEHEEVMQSSMKKLEADVQRLLQRTAQAAHNILARAQEKWQHALSDVRAQSNELQSCAEMLNHTHHQVKRKSPEDDHCSLRHQVALLKQVKESYGPCLISSRRLSIAAEKKVFEYMDKALDQWQAEKNPLELAIATRETPLDFKTAAPFEVLSQEQRVSFLEPILPQIPRPIIGIVGKLLPGFAGYRRSQFFMSDTQVNAACECDGIVAVLDYSGEHVIRCWDRNEMKHLGDAPISESGCESMCYVGQGVLALGLRDGSIEFVDVKTPDWLHRAPEYHQGRVGSLVMLSDGRLVSGSFDEIKVWRRLGPTWHEGVVQDRSLFVTEYDEAEHLEAISIALFELPDNKLLSKSDDGTLRVWSLATGQCLQTVSNRCDSVLVLDEQRVAVICGEEIQMWSTAGEELALVQSQATTRSPVNRAVYCGDDLIAYVDFGDDDETRGSDFIHIFIYSLEAGAVVQKLATAVRSDCEIGCALQFVGGRLVLTGVSHMEGLEDDGCDCVCTAVSEEWI